MNDSAIRRLEMFRRVRDFSTTYVNAFAVGSLARELFDIVNTALGELEDAGAAQSAAGGAARQGTAGKATARAALREALMAISRTARAISATMTGMEEKFRLPRNNNDQELLNVARAFFNDATALKAEFIRHELPADFLEDLNTKISAFEVAILEQNKGTEARVTARATIDAAVERGAEAVRRLTPVIRNKFRDQPPVLAAWESARHTERGPRTRPAEEGNAPAPPQ